MKKINLRSSKNIKIVSILGFFVFIIIVSVVWRIILAEDIPSIPTNLSINGTITTTTVPLVWTDNSNNEDKFNIERKLSTESGFTFLGQVGTDITNYTDTLIIPGAIYEYRVQACLSEVGCSDYSTLPSVLIPGGVTIPSVPTNLTINGTITTTTVPLVWTDNSNNEDKFNIERKLSTATTWMTLVQITTQNTTTYIDTSVTAGMSYDYRVQACLSGVGCSEYASLSNVVVLSAITTPAIPTGLLLYSTTVPPVQIHWTDNSTNEDSFKIQRKLSTASVFTSLGQVGTNITSYTDTSVAVGNSYDYKVQACSMDICSSFSEILAGVLIQSTTTGGGGTTGNTTTPTSPTGLTATVNGNNVTLIWTDNSNNEAGFKIYRGPTWTDIGNVGSNITTFTDSNRPVGTYTYHLNAFNSSYVYSGISNDVSVTIASASGSGGSSTGNGNSGNTTTAILPSVPNINTIPTISTLTTPSGASSLQPTKPTLVPTTTLPSGTINSNISAVPFVNQITSALPTISISNNTTTQVASQPNTTAPTSGVPLQIENIGIAVAEIKTAVDDTKGQLVKLINDHVSNITSNTTGQEIDTKKINLIKDELLVKVDDKLSSMTTFTSSDIGNLKNEINKGIENIQLVANENSTVITSSTNTTGGISDTLNTLLETTQNQSEAISKQGGDLLYKDTNKDGVSDYDSVYVYNINPDKPSPVSSFEGRNINASEKVLLGFDPTQTTLVKVVPEQPAESLAPDLSTYKVKEITLTEKKDVVFKGEALPNSFITLYIYSTPIMVTVKTDSRGEWQYVLDKELENGNHTVYTATVNNTGNIIAKSSGFLFTKTAEAVTLRDIPTVEASTVVNKPGLLKGNILYFSIGFIFVVVILILVLIGINRKKVIK